MSHQRQSSPRIPSAPSFSREAPGHALPVRSRRVKSLVLISKVLISPETKWHFGAFGVLQRAERILQVDAANLFPPPARRLGPIRARTRFIIGGRLSQLEDAMNFASGQGLCVAVSVIPT
jgi:hypothetical protein